MQGRLFRAVLNPVLIVSCLLAGTAVAAEESANAASIELVDPLALRVCIDPRNLPYSNIAGEGFENKLAELVARKLGKTLSYVFYPGSTGFVRNTLNAHRCDVIMGMPQGDDVAQVTNPYYRTAYALVVKQGSGLETIETLADQRLRGKRLGIVAGTPPASYLAANGLLPWIKSYPLVIDTRYDSPTSAMIEDLEQGRIDVAVLWGPIAGYFAKNSRAGLNIVPLVKENGGPRLIYRVGMGVRHSDQDWKRLLNTVIDENETEIRALLLTYGVPLLDENNAAISH
jgi:quinoprotein dehydrogenase-associated probable ABC transporter substrate-binding protein